MGSSFNNNTIHMGHHTLHSRLTIIQHNVLHWPTRKTELCNTYRKHDPHIILINSHGLNNTTPLKIFTYTVYSSNQSQERSDGVAIAIKNDIPHKIINNFTSDLLAVEVNTPQGPIILATLYIPPRRQYIPEPDILQLLRHNKPIYIMGDFNAHHTLFGYNDTNAVGRGLASYIQQGRLTHLGPHTPTYIAHHAATTPDIVLANHIAHLHYHITTDDVTSSDHLPVIITLSTNPIMTPTQPRESFKHANWEGFKQALENTQVIDLEGQPTHMINNHLEQWYTDIQTAREANIPKTTYKTIPHYRETHHLKLLKIQYRHLHELSITRGWDAQLRTRYREIQTQLTHEVRVMSNQHWETLARKLCQNTKDPKKFWSSFKMLMGSNRQTVSYIYNAHRQRVNSVEGMEALHREFWQQNFQISPAENARFDNTTETEVTNYLQQHRNLTLPENIITLNNLTEDSPLSTPITPEEIINTIKHTKNTTPGASNINKTIIEHLPPTMIRKLRHIFNACLATGYFPDKFKHATITLIAKSGKSAHEVGNYRPISLLEVPGKLLERLITRRLITHLENNNKHNSRQYGFRPHRGTESAIALAYEEIALGLANKHQINIILRDVSKAFDKVWHDGLKYKIIQLQLPTHLTRLLCSFLDHRTATIRLGSHLGTPLHLRSGVPQGSVLSPTLYILYTANLPQPTPHSNYFSYADDVTQIISHPSKSQHIMKLTTQRAIQNINTFEHHWKIQTNMNKFKLIHIARRYSQPITINNTHIPYSNRGNILGFHLSTTGFTTHIKQRITQARTILTKLRRFSCCTPRTKLRLYKTTVRPILEYTAVPLVAISHSQKLKMQSVQNKALLWVHGATRLDFISSETLHRTYSIEPLNTRIHRRAQNTWARLREQEDANYNNIIDRHTNTHNNHTWWPRTLPITETPTPAPIYASTH